MSAMLQNFALVTAAYNEDRFIEQTILSIVGQMLRPTRWIIVSDGSTDKTDDIVTRYSLEYPFIELHRITDEHPRNFAAQVNAINLGLSLLDAEHYSFIGNLDADITFDPDYYQNLILRFHSDPALGLAGGTVCERSADGTFRPRPIRSATAVPHACQLFRRECLKSIGGSYLALRYGGPDTYAEVTARMKRWKVCCFAGLNVYHHRPTNSAEGSLKGCFRQGKMDYSLGALPAFEVVKLLRRVPVEPYFIGAAARAFGFIHSYLGREARSVPPDFIAYTRSEQRQRLAALVRPGHYFQRQAQLPRLSGSSD